MGGVVHKARLLVLRADVLGRVVDVQGLRVGVGHPRALVDAAIAWRVVPDVG